MVGNEVRSLTSYFLPSEHPPQFVRRAQILKQLGVRSRKIKSSKFFAPYPTHRRTINRLRFVGKPPATEEPQVNRLLRIVVRQRLNEFKYIHIAAKFFAQFTAEALFEGFARFTLPTGKFPQAAKMRPRMTLRDEKFAVAKDEASGDFNGFHAASTLQRFNSSTCSTPHTLINPAELFHLLRIK